ncbi:hypothetical protein PRIPAC_96087 [Pristionchus pacificus]|uniref:phospholipase A2 n=1 Tax=Pristionchus pacificus TaxID=54126 RepID=A0A2A6BJM1_PRIPA|nr:hypothetical protein PRIPAC_96087 [Pristionchus pacificus]|eukprot:PDM65991.1 Ankyrin repeat-containing protein [Pristionchus pacificus]
MASEDKRHMWTLEDWAMLLDHHLTEATSKHCMFYMGESILKLEEKELQEQEKKFKISETNENALKDWAPMENAALTKLSSEPKHGQAAVYEKKKGDAYKIIVTLPDPKFEIVVERRIIYLEAKGKELPEAKSNGEKEHLLYIWELAKLMDCVITYFIKRKSRSVMKERLTHAMELLSTVNSIGISSIRKACSTENLAFRRLINFMCVGSKSPFISAHNERSDFNKCIFFWRSADSWEGNAIVHEKKQMIAAIRAVAMGRKAHPLHAAIECGDLDSIVLLLANGVDPNAKNRQGHRPLYDALLNGDVNVVKALLLFGADPKKELAKGKSFKDVARANPDFAEIVNIADENFEYKALEMDEFERRRFEKAFIEIERSLNEGAEIHNLLSLDGGGIRGLVLIEIMDALEKKYGPALLDRFKWVAGTSTGAIMALALGQGKTIAEVRKLYFRLKDLVFYRKTKFNPYPVKPLESFLKREFEEGSDMRSLDNGASQNPEKRRKNVAVTTADYSETTAKLRLFRNYPVPGLKEEDNKKSMEFKVWEAARSSSAAPMYFPPCDQKYVDGGLIANNPVLPLIGDFVTCQEASALGLGPAPNSKPAKLGVVLSLGTGWKPLANAKQLQQPELQLSACQGFGIDIFGLPTYVQTFYKTYSQLLKGMKNQILRSESSLQNARDWAFSMNGAFFRFNLNMDDSFALDETNNVKLIDLMWRTRVHMRKQKTLVDLFVKLLSKTTMESDGKKPDEVSVDTAIDQGEDKVSEFAWSDNDAAPPPKIEPSNETYVASAKAELENDPRARAQFFENDKLHLAISPDGENYLRMARKELEVDEKRVRARARFVEHENMPLAIAKEEYVKYIEYAREELEFDPNAPSRARFVAHSNMPLAIEKEEYVKYVEYAREEIENDPNIRPRAQFVAHSNKPLAIEKEEYVKYIEYAREELESDPNIRWRAQFVKNWNKPSTDIDDLPTPPPLPPSFDDIPDIDTADDSFTPTMYISPDYANELGVPQKPLRRF